MQTPNVWDFFRELLQRVGTKNPKFFNVLAWVGAIAAFITGLPALLESFGIVIPESLADLKNKIIMWCGIVITIISNLTTQRPIADAGTTKNTVITDKNVLPFTAKAEKVEAAKTS